MPLRGWLIPLHREENWDDMFVYCETNAGPDTANRIYLCELQWGLVQSLYEQRYMISLTFHFFDFKHLGFINYMLGKDTAVTWQT